jgi:hypothetical protein
VKLPVTKRKLQFSQFVYSFDIEITGLGLQDTVFKYFTPYGSRIA